jgi:hypothetical protein
MRSPWGVDSVTPNGQPTRKKKACETLPFSYRFCAINTAFPREKTRCRAKDCETPIRLLSCCKKRTFGISVTGFQGFSQVGRRGFESLRPLFLSYQWFTQTSRPATSSSRGWMSSFQILESKSSGLPATTTAENPVASARAVLVDGPRYEPATLFSSQKKPGRETHVVPRPVGSSG